MKIAHLTPTFSAFSGIDRVVYHLAAEQQAKGDEVTIFVLAGNMPPPDKVKLEVLGMPRNPTLQRIHRLILPLDVLKTRKWLPQLKGFDLVYTHQYPMTRLGCQAQRRYGVKHVYYNYGIAPPQTFSNALEGSYMRLLSLFTRLTVKSADGAISISRYLQGELKRETGLDSEVVYPAIDYHRFHTGLDGTRVRAKYQLDDRPLVLYVGRISPHKGVHLLLQAFREVIKEVPKARLLVVGEPTFPAYLRKLKGLGGNTVVFAGFVPDEELPFYYAASQVYATATLWEGFNLPLAEAQASGKPVVAFDLGPHPEVVIHGESGFLVPVRDTGALAQATIKLLKNAKLRGSMGEKAHHLVKERFRSA